MSTRLSRKTSGTGRNDLSAGKNRVEGAHTSSETRFSEDERRRMVAEAAYYRAQQRGFSAGGEVDDWLTAEREISQRLQAADASRRSGTARGAAASAKATEGNRAESRPA